MHRNGQRGKEVPPLPLSFGIPIMLSVVKLQPSKGHFPGDRMPMMVLSNQCGEAHRAWLLGYSHRSQNPDLKWSPEPLSIASKHKPMLAVSRLTP